MAKNFCRAVAVALAMLLAFVFTACDHGSSTMPEIGREVNIAYLRATFPVVNFALDIFDVNQNSTFVSLGRANTFNWERLPQNVQRIPGTTYAGFNEDGITTTAHFVRSLHQADPTIRFNLFVCDLDLAYIIHFFVNNDIPLEQVSVTAYMDGTLSINVPAQRYSGSNAMARFHADVHTVRQVFQTASEGGNWSYGLDRSDLRTGPELLDYALAVIYAFDNITWQVPSISALNTAIPMLSSVIQTLTSQNRIVERNISDGFSEIRRRGRANDLEWLLNLRWGNSEAESVGGLLNRGNGKDTLMIIGANAHTEDGLGLSSTPTTGWGFINGVNQVGLNLTGADGFMERAIERYGDRFNIFYKGHPATPSGGERMAWFDQNGVIDIPAHIPSETIMFLYDNVYVGGYPGTTFLSALSGQSIVMFGTPALFDSLLHGVNLAYFSDTEFMYVDPSSGNFVVRRR